jgi:kumamolisin
MPFQTKIALAGSERTPAHQATIAHAVDKNEIVSATVVLRPRSETSAPETYAFAPASPNIRHAREEFGVAHGAPPSCIDMVKAFAHEYGLTIVESSQQRRAVVLSGPAENMQEAFDTKLSYFDAPGGRYRGRTGEIMIPKELHGPVLAVLGLDNRPVAKPHVRIHAAQPPTSLTPPQVAKLYNFPTGVTGAGQTIGIIELGGGYRTSDLKTYFKSLGLAAPSVTTVSVDGGLNRPGVDPNSDGEVMLDIEVAAAVAPGAKIVVYFAPNTDQGFHDAISAAVHDAVHKPSVISISWGGPEDSWTPQATAAMLQAVTDAAAVGVTVTAAAGDDGATDGAKDGKLHVDLPACLPTVLACGGTRLNTSNGAFSSEEVWNELAAGEGATGGGVSKLFAIPAHQAGAGVPKHPETGFAGRGVPDVSGDADPVTGYAVRVDGKNSVIGGTSAAAPLWAGLIALLNQQLGHSVGFLHPALYKIGSSAFRDITKGNNGHYPAGAGWDASTGLGSPNGTALVKALQGKASAAETA